MLISFVHLSYSHAFRWKTTNKSVLILLHYSYRLDGVKLSGGNHFLFIMI